jgi:hypothetical protein
MVDTNVSDEVAELLRGAFVGYAHRRLAFYENPRLLSKVLDRNLVPFALRGVAGVDEFVEQVLAAYEAGSEETMLGNAWQAAIATLPHTVGGGDLRTERDGDLWIVQLKTSPKQNSSAHAQDLRMLRTKLLGERDHQPGRRSVKAMMAYLTGPSEFRWVTHKERSAANQDIDGFQYQRAVGQAFLSWIGISKPLAELAMQLGGPPAQIRSARQSALVRLKRELRARLRDEGLDDDMDSIMRLAPGRRGTTTAT